MDKPNNVELTILMPCLNEAETIAVCIEKAEGFLKKHNISGEIVIADNGSTDGSKEIVSKYEYVRVVDVPRRGYGAALIGGCNAAYGKYVIMGDADDSYDFTNLMPFVEKLREGYELVMGNRFKGGIEKGAMPPLHKYLGNPVLSFLGRVFYSSDIGDFHCGLRGYNRESILKLNLITTGMEYASEMVVQATLNNLRIAEVPTTLKKDGRSHPPHLRSFSDGWRHLKFLLMYSPDWLFLYPGIFLAALGLVFMIILEFGDFYINTISFGIHSMVYSSALMVIGINIATFSVFVKIYAYNTGFLPKNKSIEKMSEFNVDKGIFLGFIMVVIGVLLSLAAVLYWKSQGFSQLQPEKVMRLVIPALTIIEIGIQFIFSSFFIGVLAIKHK